MKLCEILLTEDEAKAKRIVTKSKVKRKKNNPSKQPGPYSFRAHRYAGLSGHLINPTARGGI